ncbi:MAG: substrate-binding domain-containing protein [Gammaproteobacteria bacterium]|nr:substrate-binding domain-containing protein [Gammaproteobacteria bacterium]
MSFQILLGFAQAEINALPVPDQVLPVVNSDNKQTEISRNGLSAIFKMRLTLWNDGTPVTVYVLPDDHQLHREFSKKILHVFPHQLRRIWNNAVFSGSGQAPIVLNSQEEMIDKVANTPGAIGFVSTNNLTENIKILQVQ